MSAESIREPIVLRDLATTRFDLKSADLVVFSGVTGLSHPELQLKGDADAFDHSLERGVLTVQENDTHSVSTNVFNELDGIVVTGSGHNIIVTGGRSVISSGVMTIVDGNIINVGGTALSRRKATLSLPVDFSASHEVETRSGDVTLLGLLARDLKVISRTGSILLKSAITDYLLIASRTGEVEIEDVHVRSPVKVTTRTGNIEVRGSSAPAWMLSARTGNVKVKDCQGEVDASSKTGHTRIS